jgi:ammonia channel protein AmtB
VKVTAFFKETGKFDDALRAAGVHYGAVHLGVTFDDAAHSEDGRFVQLTRGGKRLIVPTANILMIQVEEVAE